MQLSTHLTLLATLALTTTAYNQLSVTLYSDNDCQQHLADITVTADTCATPNPGWSSMQITDAVPLDAAGTLTAYTVNNCGNPAAGSHGYSVSDKGCLKDFGFVANAAGFRDATG